MYMLYICIKCKGEFLYSCLTVAISLLAHGWKTICWKLKGSTVPVCLGWKSWTDWKKNFVTNLIWQVSGRLQWRRRGKVIHTYAYMHTFYVYLLLIRWQRSWGLAHRCCQLQSLSRLAEQNPEALINLQGKCSNNNVLTDMDDMDFYPTTYRSRTDWFKLQSCKHVIIKLLQPNQAQNNPINIKILTVLLFVRLKCVIY